MGDNRLCTPAIHLQGQMVRASSNQAQNTTADISNLQKHTFGYYWQQISHARCATNPFQSKFSSLYCTRPCNELRKYFNDIWLL